MRRLRKLARFGVVAIAALAMTLVLGIDSAAAQKRGGELHSIINLEPGHLGIGLNLQIPTQVISSKILQSLIKYDFDFNPVPVLATSWTAAPDGKTYTFKLRQGVTWHDGKPFSAADVVFTIEEIMPLHPLSRRVFVRLESITAPDDYTVVFKLKKPYAAFMSAFDISSVPIYPKHLYEGTDYKKSEYNSKPVGTGPFKFVEWKRGSFVKLARNDSYWKKGLPYLDAIYFHVLPDPATRALQLEQGKVHFTSWGNIEGPDVRRLQAKSHLEMTTKGYEMIGTMMWLEFNHRKEPFNDVRFRKAIAHAINREFIRDNIYYGLGKIPNGPLSTVTRYYDPNTKMDWEYNPEKAKKLLDEMGLKPDSNGIRLTTTLLPIAAVYGEQYVRSGEYVKQALADVGIDAKIQAVDAPTWIKRMANGEFDLMITFMGQYGDPDLGVARSYISSNIKKGVPFNNTAGYRNAKVDELFDKGAIEMDQKKRGAIYSELQQVMVDDVPVIWFLEYELPHFINKKFKDVIVDVHGNKGDFEKAYLAE